MPNEPILEFLCETWQLSHGRPALLKRQQTIRFPIDEAECNWAWYTREVDANSLKVGRASFAAFGDQCQTLRIGARIHVRDAAGDFNHVPIFGLRFNMERPYIEEFACRGRFVVLASRMQLTESEFLSPEQELAAQAKPPPTEPNRVPPHRANVANAESDESDEEYDVESLSGSEGDDGYMSWSESSSVLSQDELVNEDFLSPWAGHPDADSDENSSDSDSLMDDTSDDGSSNSNDEQSADSTDDDEEPTVPRGAFAYGGMMDEDEDEWNGGSGVYSDDEEAVGRNLGIFVPLRSKAKGREARRNRATIVILDVAAQEDYKMFQLTRQLQCNLYGSPPIIHPTAPLVVWPLSAGDVLFVDFVAESYFIRKLRPTTSFSK